MRVLITGAGLIGTHTAKKLLERGDEVTFFDFAPRPDYIRHVTGRDLPVIRAVTFAIWRRWSMRFNKSGPSA